VNPGGWGGCYKTINAAVAAASPNDVIDVGAGTYKESVTITKPLSLAGTQATIDAEGFSRGIFVNGLAANGLANVHVSGFTIKKANFEGILVANASEVSISNNTVTGNNLALNNGSCPGIEAFEPGEQGDCGEGIHLLGADHAIVTGNTVHGNSGGILLSDDTGATHDNLISFNQVSDNPFACGIVLASHPASSYVPSGISPGVYHNTVYRNSSEYNGYSAGGGAGVGIFASVPGAANYGNVIVENYLARNGHQGISMHAHVPGQHVADNMLVGNTVVNNGADTADAATPGPTGINLYAAGPGTANNTGNMVSANSIQQETDDVAVSVPSPVIVEFNNLSGRGAGVDNIPGAGGVGLVDATWNWWGCFSGPSTSGACASATGANVLFAPWLIVPEMVPVSF
jgi:parallel beta-helix repeat protein